MIVRSTFRILPPVVGSYRFCRAVSAVCICCSTNSKLRTPHCTFVTVGTVVTISVACSPDHPNIISDSLITPSKECRRLLRPLLKIFLFASQFLRTTKALHVSQTWSVFPKLSCRETVDGTYCFCQFSLINNLGFQRDNFLMKLSDDLLNRQRHSRIHNVRKHEQTTANSRVERFSCSSPGKS